MGSAWTVVLWMGLLGVANLVCTDACAQQGVQREGIELPQPFGQDPTIQARIDGPATEREKLVRAMQIAMAERGESPETISLASIVRAEQILREWERDEWRALMQWIQEIKNRHDGG